MARHSHWAQIKLKKGALDKKRGKIFSRHAHLIEIATQQGGGDPDINPSLRLAIENARSDNMPCVNIERAIKKGTGELKSEALMQEVTYEGFGPGGIALIIEALTDNKNRTSQTVRNILQKYGGTLGGVGSTTFLFEIKGMIFVQKKTGTESDELEIIDAGAENFEGTDDGFVVYTSRHDFSPIRKDLKARGFVVISAKLKKLPKDQIKINDAAIEKKIKNLLEALEEEDDVMDIVINAGGIGASELAEKLKKANEKNREDSGADTRT